jgi:hypothetical protein
MAVSRRHLLGFAPAFLAATTTPTAFAQESHAAERTAGLTREGFAKLVNSSFTVQLATGTHAYLVLGSVEDLNRKADSDESAMAVPPPRRRSFTPQTDSFALHFYGAGAGLSQQTYTVEHDSLGRFELFLVPSGPSSYTATFNRLVGPGSRR